MFASSLNLKRFVRLLGTLFFDRNTFRLKRHIIFNFLATPLLQTPWERNCSPSLSSVSGFCKTKSTSTVKKPSPLYQFKNYKYLPWEISRAAFSITKPVTGWESCQNISAHSNWRLVFAMLMIIYANTCVSYCNSPWLLNKIGVIYYSININGSVLTLFFLQPNPWNCPIVKVKLKLTSRTKNKMLNLI